MQFKPLTTSRAQRPRLVIFQVLLALMLLVHVIKGHSQAHKSEKPDYSIGLTAAALFDYDFPGDRVGKVGEVSMEQRLWKNLYLKGSLHFSNTQQVLGNRYSGYILSPAIGVDQFANFLRGRDASYAIGYANYIKNERLWQLSLAYRFGRRNQFIPELGLVAGTGYMATMGTQAWATSGDTITSSVSSSSIGRTPLSGVLMGLHYAAHIKNRFYIQPSLRLHLVLPENITYARRINQAFMVFDGFSLGVTARKDLFWKKSKPKDNGNVD